MTEQEFVELLALGYERRGVEFKGPGALGVQPLTAKVIRAMLGMANRQDGGLVVIGVEDSDGKLNSVGVGQDELSTWKFDELAAKLAAYADPYVSFELEQHEHERRSYVLLAVQEFEEVPVLCRKQFDPVLRSGACYVRTRRIPETSEIPSQTEMRELLALATTKTLRKFLAQATAAGLLTPVAAAEQPSDADQYETELQDFF